MYGWITSIVLVGLVGFLIWLWRRDANKETARLYRFIDDMFDRINSNTIEEYAMTNRIKHDIGVQTRNVPQTKKKRDIVEEKVEPKFVHQRR